MDEHKEEIAALYAIGLLDPQEAQAFEAELGNDEELRKFVDDLLQHSTALAHAVPLKEAPPHLREKILRDIKGGESRAVSSSKVVEFPKRPFPWMPWAMAAGFAVMSGWLAMDRSKLVAEIDRVRSQNDVCQMQVAMLDSGDNERPGVATVVWDASTQTGVIRSENMPRPASNQDYQLWVLDPEYPAPVNAGVVSVDEGGAMKTIFKPNQQVSKADKFAISIEPKGGVEKHDKGKIVMVGSSSKQ